MNIIEHTFKTKSRLSYRKSTQRIILHCEATPEGKDYSVQTVDTWHKNRGFSCIGYHFVIYRNGEVHRGRPEKTIGSHCTGYNSTSIGISYVGGVTKDCKTAKDTRTPEQKAAMFELVHDLLVKYGLNMNNIYCHNQLTSPPGAKACPSFSISTFKHEYLEYFKSKG